MPRFPMIIKHWRYIFWIYITTILLLAVLPINGVENTLDHSFIFTIRLDHWLHSVQYIPCIPLYLLAFRPDTPGKYATMFLICLGFAIVSEGVQIFLTYRAFTLRDMASNLIGVLIGSLALMGKIKTFLYRFSKV